MECGKICYDLKGAKSELNVVNKLGKKYRREIRYYKCPICENDCYHLTSHEEFEEREEIPIEQLKFCEKWKSLQIDK